LDEYGRIFDGLICGSGIFGMMMMDYLMGGFKEDMGIFKYIDGM